MRTMHPCLARELDSLTAAERRIVVRLSNEGHGSPLLTRLLNGLKWQILADSWAEDAVMRRLEADRLAEIDRVDRRVNGDPPPIEGRPASFDPDTGRWDHA